MAGDTHQAAPKEAHYRSDIDGLRAVAVLGVVLFHAFPSALPGGFVGVDVFFVISGFLITRIIVADLGRERFSLADFYGRRIRRIFPALSLVLLACLVVGWQVLLANEYAQLGLHLAAGAGFFSNLALWNESGYFDTASDLKPLLHLWSLGIEEQFYIAWPCVVWVAYKTSSRWAGVTLLLLLASFAWNVFTVGHDAVSAFYLPYGRAWELLIGAGLALMRQNPSPRQVDFLQRHRNMLSTLGITLMGVSMGVLDKEAMFPGGWALLPTLGAALLIASQGAWVNRKILSLRGMVAIGLISYPLYLWHWPLLSFGRIIENGELPAGSRAVLVLVAVVLSVFTYRYVERPLRHRGGVLTASLLLVVLVLGFLGWNVYSREGLEFRYRKIIELPAQMKRDFTKWEDKGMYPEGVCSPDFVYPNARICLQSKEGLPPRTIVFGDSHAFHAYWGIAQSLATDRHVVKLVGRGGCNFGLYHDNADCIGTFERQLAGIVADPAVENVIVVHRLVIRSDSLDSDKLDYQRRLETAMGRLVQNGKHVVYVHPVPELRFNPRLCASKLPLGRQVDGSQCDFGLERELALQRANRDLVARWRQQFPTLEVFDPADTLCPIGRCQAVRDGQVLWMDDNHVSETGSYMLGAAMAKALKLR